MKKYFKYPIAFVIAASLAVWFLPFVTDSDRSWNLLQFMKIGFGFYEAAGETALIYGRIREFCSVFAVGIAAFGGVVLSEVLLTVLLPGIGAYIFSLLASIVNCVAVVVFLWLSDVAFTDMERNLAEIEVYVSMSIDYQTVFIFLAIHLVILLLSAIGICLCRLSVSEDVEKINPMLSENIFEDNSADIVSSDTTNIPLRYKFVEKRYPHILYHQECLEKIYFATDEVGVAVTDAVQTDSVAELWYMNEIYYVKPYRKAVVFLKSGQPLGKGRIYSLPQGREIYIENKQNRFILM